MTITNINLLGKEEPVQSTVANKQKGYHVEESGIGYMQPGAFFDGGVEQEALSGEGLQEKAKSMFSGMPESNGAYLANTFGEVGNALLEEQGISAKDEDVDTMVTVVEKIQLQIAKSGKTQNSMLNLSADQIKSVVGDGAMAYSMAAQLKEITKEETAYLINNNMEPTIGNIYQAQSSTLTEKKYIPLDKEVGRKVQEKLAEYTGEVTVTAKDKELAEWMVSTGVEFTKESFTYAKELLDLQLPPQEMQVNQMILSAVQVGKSATEAVLLPSHDMVYRAEQGVQIVQQAKTEDVVELMETGKDINLSNLAELQHKNKKLIHELISEKSEETFIKARRILEETRLYMTAKANLSLLKKGIQIETKPLQDLVEDLKKQEEEYIKKIYAGNEEGEEIFSASNKELRQFAQVPAYSLPQIKFGEMTLSEAVVTGQQMALTFEKANASYETMMTQPRRDLGDHIQKAFRNTGAILEELGMEITPGNERAVRILGYNQMEITTEALLMMKQKDEQVQQLFSNMTPRVVLTMIRQGFNPLKVTLDELNKKAEEIHLQSDEGGIDSYGKFLVELEQRKDITAEEREAYIGIYRLLHQVTKSDGAAVGALVKADEELTMQNLLTQVRNRRAMGYEKVVDEKTGEKTEDFSADTSITSQINAAFQLQCAKEAVKKISVSGLKEAEKGNQLMHMTPEELLQSFRDAEAVPSQVAEYISEQEQEMIRQTAMAERQVLEMLHTLDLPKSPENILALQQMLTDRNRLFKNLFGEKNKTDELKEELKEIKENLLKDMAEALSAPEDMARAQETLADTAEHIMDSMMDDADITSLDIRQLRQMRSQLQILNARSKKEEYAVPVMVSDEFGMIQLKIVRGEKEHGKVAITFESEAGKKIAASFSATKADLQGYVVADDPDVLEQLKEADDRFREGIYKHTGQEMEKGSISYILSRELSLNRFENGFDRAEDGEAEKDQIQTRTLYGLAKGFLLNLREISL